MGKIDHKAVCTRIREAREAKGLSMAEMADALELHVNTWGRYERDTVPFKYIRQIADVLGVSQGWLLRGEVDEAQLLRELVLATTNLERAAETQLAATDELTRRLDRLTANLEKLQDSLLPNAERYRGRPDHGKSGGGGMPAVAAAQRNPE